MTFTLLMKKCLNTKNIHVKYENLSVTVQQLWPISFKEYMYVKYESSISYRSKVCQCYSFLRMDNVTEYLTLSQTSPGLWEQCLQNKSFENTVGKGEIARNEQFLLFPTVFSTHLENFVPFLSNLKLLSAHSFNLEESKIYCLGKG